MNLSFFCSVLLSDLPSVSISIKKCFVGISFSQAVRFSHSQFQSVRNQSFIGHYNKIPTPIIDSTSVILGPRGVFSKFENLIYELNVTQSLALEKKKSWFLQKVQTYKTVIHQCFIIILIPSKWNIWILCFIPMVMLVSNWNK